MNAVTGAVVAQTTMMRKRKALVVGWKLHSARKAPAY